MWPIDYGPCCVCRWPILSDMQVVSERGIKCFAVGTNDDNQAHPQCAPYRHLGLATATPLDNTA